MVSEVRKFLQFWKKTPVTGHRIHEMRGEKRSQRRHFMDALGRTPGQVSEFRAGVGQLSTWPNVRYYFDLIEKTDELRLAHHYQTFRSLVLSISAPAGWDLNPGDFTSMSEELRRDGFEVLGRRDGNTVTLTVNSNDSMQIQALVRLAENSEARKSGARQQEHVQNPVAFAAQESLAQKTLDLKPSVADEYFKVFSGTGVRVRLTKEGRSRGPGTSVTLTFTAPEGEGLDSGFFQSFFENMRELMESEGYMVMNRTLAPNEVRVDVSASPPKIAELEMRVRRWEAKQIE